MGGVVTHELFNVLRANNNVKQISYWLDCNCTMLLCEGNLGENQPNLYHWYLNCGGKTDCKYGIQDLFIDHLAAETLDCTCEM